MILIRIDSRIMVKTTLPLTTYCPADSHDPANPPKPYLVEEQLKACLYVALWASKEKGEGPHMGLSILRTRSGLQAYNARRGLSLAQWDPVPAPASDLST